MPPGSGHGPETRCRIGILHQLDFLFIENVGNLVCPSSYDLGENLRLVLMSVTEGEDKPLKYPTIFNSADVAVITKNELAAAVEFDWETARKSIESVRPGMQIFRLSAKTGDGMDEYFDFSSSDCRKAAVSRQPETQRYVRLTLCDFRQRIQGSCHVCDKQRYDAGHGEWTIAGLKQVRQNSRHEDKQERNCRQKKSCACNVRVSHSQHDEQNGDQQGRCVAKVPRSRPRDVGDDATGNAIASAGHARPIWSATCL